MFEYPEHVLWFEHTDHVLRVLEHTGECATNESWGLFPLRAHPPRCSRNKVHFLGDSRTKGPKHLFANQLTTYMYLYVYINFYFFIHHRACANGVPRVFFLSVCCLPSAYLKLTVGMFAVGIFTVGLILFVFRGTPHFCPVVTTCVHFWCHILIYLVLICF